MRALGEVAAWTSANGLKRAIACQFAAASVAAQSSLRQIDPILNHVVDNATQVGSKLVGDGLRLAILGIHDDDAGDEGAQYGKQGHEVHTAELSKPVCALLENKLHLGQVDFYLFHGRRLGLHRP
jgi:hypothetical protein